MSSRKTHCGIGLAVLLLFAGPSMADLLGIETKIGFPRLSFNNTNNTATLYNPATRLFTVSAFPTVIMESPANGIRFINPTGTPSTEAFTIRILVDNLGQLLGGDAGDDLVIRGEVDLDGDGSVDHAGVLLTGEISPRDFGFQDTGTVTDKYELLFDLTGGSLLSIFPAGSQLGVVLTSENSTFVGSFLAPITGRAKGTSGPHVPPPGPQDCTGAIGDFVWHDQDRNGVQDGGEPGLNGVIVHIDDGMGGAMSVTTFTGSRTGGSTSRPGFYLFENLCAGDYVVDLDESSLPAALKTPTLPDAGLDDTADSNQPLDGAAVMISLPAADTENLTLDFGFVSACTGRIGDFVWHDENRNGVQDLGEAPIDGAQVLLRDAAGSVIGTATSGADGVYEFTGLCAGDYTVDVNESTLPTDLRTPTESDLGGDDTTDSDGPADGGFVMVSLIGDDAEDLTIDFGYVSLCTGVVGDFVWHDQNRNGVQDPSEPGIQGATVILKDGAGATIATDITSANGAYEFTGLYADSYTVNVDESTLPPALTTPTEPDQGGDDAADSDGPIDGPFVTVALGDDDAEDLTIDFGYVSPCTGVIGDFVWHDQNRNGIQDANEPGIQGAKVILKDSQGAQVGMTTTGANGFYQFTGLCADTYTVNVDETTLPVDLREPTLPNLGGDDATDSDGPFDGGFVTVSLIGDDAEDLTIDLGYVSPCTGVIGDFVWHDQDRDGIQDLFEPGIEGATVILKDSQGAQVGTATTGANGFYQFTGLCADTYTVNVDETTLPVALRGPTLPDLGGDDGLDSDGPFDGGFVSVSLIGDDAEDLTIDLGYVSPCTGVIGDFVWHDQDRDGFQDSNEPGIQGATVILKDSAGNVAGTTTTGPDGFYEFTGLCAGDYTVNVDETTLPAPLRGPTLPDLGDDALDSDGPSDGSFVAVSLIGDDAEDLTIDFGYVSPCEATIGDFVWEDPNLNGVQDVGEPGIQGVTVRLRNPADNTLIATTTTGFFGFYEFTGLCAGDYKVEVVAPAGFQSTTSDAGLDDGADSDASPVLVNLPNDFFADDTIDFGFFRPAPAIDIRKQAEGPDSRTVVAGNDVSFEIVVTNTGNLPLANVQVTDSLLPACSQFIGNLAVGGSVSYLCDALDVTAGFTNVATVTGRAGSATVQDSDPSTVDVEQLTPPGGVGEEGCTPGYWKQPQHFDSWVGYSPNQPFSAVFKDAFPGKTLLQVLSQGGGGLKAVGRHTVAALLNARSSDVDYDIGSPTEVIARFNAVFPGSTDSYNGLKNVFENFNEQGCPLN